MIAFPMPSTAGERKKLLSASGFGVIAFYLVAISFYVFNDPSNGLITGVAVLNMVFYTLLFVIWSMADVGGHSE